MGCTNMYIAMQRHPAYMVISVLMHRGGRGHGYTKAQCCYNGVLAYQPCLAIGYSSIEYIG